jgi:hypothetical protein
VRADVRLGGRVALPNGDEVVFSVAEGSRGRRWREATLRDDRLVRSLLLEATRGGRPARLEITSDAGLLTVHPGASGTEVHGNIVASQGIQHLRLPLSPDHVLFIVDSPAAAAVAIGDLATRVGVGEHRHIQSLAIGTDLVPRAVGWSIERATGDEWILRSDLEPADRHMRLDPDGLALIPGMVRWPLELD